MPEEPVPRVVLTRDSLADGSHFEAVRRNLPPGMLLLDAPALEASLTRALQGHDPAADVMLFGYGSLMWNPAFHYIEAKSVLVRGWHRRFCLWSTIGRGSPHQPGLMLGLDRGGSCRGMLFRIDAKVARDELRLVWRREMSTGTYHPKWVTAEVDGRPQRALTFVVNRAHERYVGNLPINEAIGFIRRGCGRLGSCEEYFNALIAQLRSMSVRDTGMERLRAALHTKRNISVETNP